MYSGISCIGMYSISYNIILEYNINISNILLSSNLYIRNSLEYMHNPKPGNSRSLAHWSLIKLFSMTMILLPQHPS